MDLQSLVGSSLLKQNQFLFDKKEYDRNMQAVDQAREAWKRRIEKFRRLMGRVRAIHQGLPTTTPTE